MGFNMKNMAYWKSKNAFPGINNKSEGNTNLPDGRSASSPFQKNGDDDKKVQGPKTNGNVKLQPSENKDTSLTGGKEESLSEKINDYEDRIEFIKEDIYNTDKTTPQQKTDLAKLKNELAILRRGSKKPPFKKKKY